MTLHPRTLTYALLGVLLGFGFAFVVGGAVSASSLGPITGALQDANAEARGPILTAVSSILAAFVLISIGAGVAKVLTRST